MTLCHLPVREISLAGESLNGFVRRHVQAMGYDRYSQLLSLIEDAEIPADLNAAAAGPFLTKLARWLRCDERRLGELTVHCWADRLVVRARGSPPARPCDSKTLLRYFTSASRVCRGCLSDEPNRERLLWSFRPLGICREHAEVLLSQCPNCRRSLSARRLDLVRCPCGHLFSEGSAVAVSERPVELARRFSAWLEGTSFSTVKLSTAAGLGWLDRLRSSIIRAPKWLAHVRRKWTVPSELDDESLAWLAAADLIETWPQGFEEFLDIYQTVDKHLSSATGVGRSFGLLLRDADRLERAGYSTPAETLRNYLLAKYRRGHLTRKVILFRSPTERRRLRERPWLTQTDAARRLRVRVPTIAGLIQRGALIGEIRDAGGKGRTIGVVSAESVERLQSRLAETLSVAVAAERLGVERHRVLDLIRAKILGEAVRTARGWRISLASVDELLMKVSAVPVISRKDGDRLSLREATRSFGGELNLIRIVDLVCNGKLPALRDPHEVTLRGLRFADEDLRRAVASLRDSTAAEAGYTLNRLAGMLIPGRPLKEIVLRKWIAAGLLRSRRLRRGWQIRPAEVERFRATYCLAPDVCRLLGVTRSTLARDEAAGRITAIYGRRSHAGAGASVFLRADVERWAAARAA